MTRVLLVDDEPGIRRRVRALLVEALPEGEIVEAGTVEHARAHIQTGPWSLIVLDLGLPDGSGLDLLREVRELDGTAPVLVFSGHEADEYAPIALNLGASAYVEKLRTNEDFLPAVKRILGPKSSAQPMEEQIK